MRLFTAICPDEEIKNALFAAENEAAKSAAGRFSLKENLHLTLVFIGETERCEDAKNAISQIEFPAFDIKTSGIGTFEKGIFFAEIEKNEKLSLLQKTVAEKLEAAGFEFEEREYIPHITLARKFAESENFNGAAVIKKLPEKPFRAEKISLMKSENTEGILRYTEIYSKELY
ncbi:MAG: RNA 2',3'-cyclic phosphodiesterase [Oscillospiraceae bacterium]|nr:RNA 2',3'-cyclic phosphodiesterase [Oscillospiraceae bacterium]